MALSRREKKILLLSLALYRIQRNKRRWWMQPYFQKRTDTGAGTFYNLLTEMRLTDFTSFLDFFRVTPTQFEHLLSIVGNMISPNEASIREPISARDRLAVTLRFLASGDSMKSISCMFRISTSSVTKIIFNVCRALWESLMPIVIPQPNVITWEKVATQMDESFQFPHCIGAIGGRIVKQALVACDSKNPKCVSFLAICDTQHKFLIVDIAKFEKCLKFSTTDLGMAVDNEELNLPPPIQVIGTKEKIPYVFAGNLQFRLTDNIMRPYPDNTADHGQAVFNYRLSRCYNLIDNAFGVMCARFRIFSKPINAKAPTVQAITMAVACLHNYLLTNEDDSSKYYCPEGFCDHEDPDGTFHQGEWRECVEDLGAMGNIDFSPSNHKLTSARYREALKNYFCECRTVPCDWIG